MLPLLIYCVFLIYFPKASGRANTICSSSLTPYSRLIRSDVKPPEAHLGHYRFLNSGNVSHENGPCAQSPTNSSTFLHHNLSHLQRLSTMPQTSPSSNSSTPISSYTPSPTSNSAEFYAAAAAATGIDFSQLTLKQQQKQMTLLCQVARQRANQPPAVRPLTYEQLKDNL